MIFASQALTWTGQFILGILVLGTAYLSKKKVSEVHVLVNSQKAELERRIGELEGALQLKRGEELKTGSTVTVKQETDV